MIHTCRRSLYILGMLYASMPALTLPRLNASVLVSCYLCACTRSQVGVERATEWARSTLASNEHWSVTIECDKKHTADSKQCAKLLADMLTVLRAVPWDSTAPDARASVYLQRWPMTRPVMQALQGLPEWSRLDFGWDFSAKMWPLAYKEYRQLATYVPRSYTDWDIHVSKESPLYTHICTGRTAGGTD